MDISRRSFIKGGLAAIGAAGASRLPLPASVKAANRTELATLIDIRKCIGCEACVEACQESNAVKYPEPTKPIPKMFPDRVPVEDWSDKRDVTDRPTPYNWLFIQEAVVNVNGEEDVYTIPRRCMHCQNPPCADLCPFGSARKKENGITVIDSETCLGGKKCKAVCPWSIPERQSGVGLYLNILPQYVGNGVMFKCDRCYDKIEKGPGRPHLNAVDNSMEQDENLAKAMIVDYFLLTRKTFSITRVAYTEIILIGGIVVTGVFRFMKNMPDIYFSPFLVRIIDLTHLLFAMVFLMSVVLFIILRKTWAVSRN